MFKSIRCFQENDAMKLDSIVKTNKFKKKEFKNLGFKITGQSRSNHGKIRTQRQKP